MASDGLTLIFQRNAFYRRQYLLCLSVFGLCLLVIAVLIWMLVYIVKNPVHPLYFATDEVGKLIDVVPVSQANMSNDEVIQWASDAVQAAYAYNFINYRDQLQTAEQYFTPYGWITYMKALESSNNLVALTERKMIFIANIVDTPVITKEGVTGAGIHAWRIQMPLLVTFWLPPYDDKSKFSNALQISLTILREPILESYKGLGITQMIASTGEAPPSQ